MNKQPQLTEQTKQNLRTAFWKLYEEKSIEKITVKEVTALAGYNRATFYLYYQDIYDLQKQIEDVIITEMKEALSQCRIESLSDTIPALLNILTVDLLRYRDCVRILLGEHGDPGFAAQFKAAIWPFVTKWLLESKKYTDYELSLLAEYYLSGIVAVIVKWTEDPRISVQDLVRLIVPAAFPGAEAAGTPEEERSERGEKDAGRC